MPDTPDHLDDRDPADGTSPIGCEDCLRADSAVTDVTPVDYMPIPPDALVGFPDGVPLVKEHDRRSFLRNGAIGTAAVYGASKINWTKAFEAAQASAAVPQAAVVMLYINGGFDGLAALMGAGAEYDILTQERSVVMPGDANVTPVPGTADAFLWSNLMLAGPGNNDNAGGIDSVWGAGDGTLGSDLAIFPATGFTERTNRSHFEARDWWFNGDNEDTTTGWLGNWIDLYGSPDNPLQAVTVGRELSKQIKTARNPVSAIQDIDAISEAMQAGAPGGGPKPGALNLDPLPVVKQAADKKTLNENEHLREVRKNYSQWVDVQQRLAAFDPNAPVPPAVPGAPGTPFYPEYAYPTGSRRADELSDKLKTASALLSAGLGTRVVTIDWGSVDTHDDQKSRLDPQVQILSAGLAAFQSDLFRRGLHDRVMTVCFSEFGRRIFDNGNGTDHGDAGLVMAMGTQVNGGILGPWPGVAENQRSNGAVRPVTGFRNFQSSVIGEFLGGDPGRVVPGNHPYGWKLLK